MPLNSKRPIGPRLAPIEPPYAADAEAALTALGPPLSLFRVFARRPERAHGIRGWGRYYLSRQLALSLRHRELVIDRTTARCGAEYEWGVHITAFGSKVELTREQIVSLAHGGADDACWEDPGDRAVLAAVDALCAESDLEDGAWDALVAAVGEEGAVDLLLLCGWYHAISFVARTARLPGEEGAARFGDYPAPGPPS